MSYVRDACTDYQQQQLLVKIAVIALALYAMYG